MASNLRLLLRPLICIYSKNNNGVQNIHRWVAPTLKTLYKRKQEMDPEQPLPKSAFIGWNYQAELYAFGKRLGEEFQEDILRQALIEKSYIELEEEKQRKVGIEPELELKDNESLASDGEKFIRQYSEQYLKTVLPRLPHEYIENIVNDLTKENNLAHIGKNIGIDDLVLSKDFPLKEESLSLAFKAVVQTLVLSSGPEKAGSFIRDFVITQLVGKDLSPLCTPRNPLQTLQSVLGSITESRIIAESGKNSLLANYQVGIYLDRKLVGRGCGESAETAEEMAALDGLWRIWGVTFNKRPFPFKLELPPASLRV